MTTIIAFYHLFPVRSSLPFPSISSDETRRSGKHNSSVAGRAHRLQSNLLRAAVSVVRLVRAASIINLITHLPTSDGRAFTFRDLGFEVLSSHGILIDKDPSKL